MPQSYRITSYTPAHLSAVTAIYAHHVHHGTASFEEVGPSVAELAQRFARLGDDGYPILVALADDDSVLGYAYAGPHKLRSAYRFTVEDSIYVAPNHERRGIGSALLEALITACQTKEYRQMIAVIGDSDNAPSIKLHEACGFQHIGTAQKVGFKFGRWLDVVFMQRCLHDSDD